MTRAGVVYLEGLPQLIMLPEKALLGLSQQLGQLNHKCQLTGVIAYGLLCVCCTCSMSR